MERVHGQGDAAPDFKKRTVDVIRDLLRDMQCTEKADINVGWGSSDIHAGQATRVPFVWITFEGRKMPVWNPNPHTPDGLPIINADGTSGRPEMETTCASFRIELANFATGGIYNDDEIRVRVRAKLEGYLLQFTKLPGINAPVDFRLSEWEYA